MGISKKIVLIGAGGHGLVLADIAKLNGYDEIVFLEDVYKRQELSLLKTMFLHFILTKKGKIL